MVNIKVKKLYHSVRFPTKATEGSSGYDLYVHYTVHLKDSPVDFIHTGLAVAIPPGYEGQIRSRSGLSSKGITVVNSPGTIDSDYRGEIIILLTNKHGNVKIGDRVAQLVIQKIPEVNLIEVDELDETKRGIKGIGSSGV